MRIPTRSRSVDHGFTLIELLVVIVILGVVAAIVVASVVGVTDKGDTSACKAEVTSVIAAEEALLAQDGAYTSSMATLVNTDHLLHALPVYVGSYDTTNNVVVLGGGTSTKTAPSGCTAE